MFEVAQWALFAMMAWRFCSLSKNEKQMPPLRSHRIISSCIVSSQSWQASNISLTVERKDIHPLWPTVPKTTENPSGCSAIHPLVCTAEAPPYRPSYLHLISIIFPIDLPNLICLHILRAKFHFRRVSVGVGTACPINSFTGEEKAVRNA